MRQQLLTQDIACRSRYHIYAFELKGNNLMMGGNINVEISYTILGTDLVWWQCHSRYSGTKLCQLNVYRRLQFN